LFSVDQKPFVSTSITAIGQISFRFLRGAWCSTFQWNGKRCSNWHERRCDIRPK
uniref:SRCR domain-containing protein n=1 Tax=Haemonchus placei TaxID=6290 RepID=A0A0N4VUX9_HAEPC